MEDSDHRPSRKAEINRWLLAVFAIGTSAYLVTLSFLGQSLPENFMTNLAIGATILGGSAGSGRYIVNRIHQQQRAPQTSSPDNQHN